MIEGCAAYGRNLLFEGEFTIEFNAKIATPNSKIKIIVAKGNGRIEQFQTLLRCTNKKVFSFRWIYGESVRGEPSIYRIKCR